MLAAGSSQQRMEVGVRLRSNGSPADMPPLITDDELLAWSRALREPVLTRRLRRAEPLRADRDPAIEQCDPPVRRLRVRRRAISDEQPTAM